MDSFLNNILELFKTFWDRLLPFEVIEEYRGGIILRLGKFNRTVKPGLNWKIPFIEEILERIIVTRTLNLPGQSLVTKDNKTIVISTILRYSIWNIKKYLLNVYDADSAIIDTSLGVIKNYILSWDYNNIKEEPRRLENLISSSIGLTLVNWGIKLEGNMVTIVDFQPTRSLRLFVDYAYKNDAVKDD